MRSDAFAVGREDVDRTVDSDGHVVATTEVGVAGLVDDQHFLAAFVLHLHVQKRLRAEGLDDTDLAGDAGAISLNLRCSGRTPTPNVEPSTLAAAAAISSVSGTA